MPRRSTKRAAAPPGPTLALDEILDITAAGDLARKLLALRGLPIAIDASGVRHVGAQCSQVLLSAARTWEADAQTFRLLDPSAEFTEGLRLLGLASALTHDARQPTSALA
ncbi:MAG TPA: STAS domain-containing protein [Lichenihabitans sp.]|nr:STAS domain-containing protein [Lichenihabitans sp.]